MYCQAKDVDARISTSAETHFQLLKTFRSTGEQHLTAAPENKNLSTEETCSWTPDFRKDSPSQEGKTTVLFILVLHVQTLEHGGDEILLFKSLQTQLKNEPAVLL